jgi:membrane-associated protein
VGPAVIVPAYFVPFGVVAATLLCGALRMPVGAVVVASAVGAALWWRCSCCWGSRAAP